MTTVQNGSTVTFNYRGTLSDGSEFDSSYERNEPMTITTGEGNLITGFENALAGMAAGETKTFTIEAADAYGNRDEEAFSSLDKAMFPDDFGFNVGMAIPLKGPEGQQVIARLTEVADTTVTVDLNHPLAGQDLTFEVEVVTVGEAE
tara:strand:- start:795 stop:1235 length:441 start_codon:yes stop_codon:yes gene_type:complete